MQFNQMKKIIGAKGRVDRKPKPGRDGFIYNLGYLLSQKDCPLSPSLFEALPQKDCPLSPLNLPLLQAMAGDGILRDTPSPSSTREPSPVREKANDEIFCEIDSYPANPLVCMTTATGQDLPASSSNQAVEPPTEGVVSQSMGDQGEDSDDLLSYLVNSLPVSFTDSQL
ncbi:hypothetical protein LIER_20197 [Lithospermum erythrorhizon]|uniref:Uncharacterized protein n=1 Tax=Lithospermum erythrorhizon TaxID=34254 RepID=A0AAV3QLQ0_LITER